MISIVDNNLYNVYKFGVVCLFNIGINNDLFTLILQTINLDI